MALRRTPTLLKFGMAAKDLGQGVRATGMRDHDSDGN